ncbi:MAG: translocation/assembly module TamB [Flavobacteriales bacterium]|nr:translocation/assembly module TamB [Flavobacteriales bacterium]
MSPPSADTNDAKPPNAQRSRGRRWLRVVAGLLLLPLLITALAALLLYLPPVQDLVRGKAVAILREKTGTRVELEALRLRFPLGLKLEGLFVADQRGDTLLHAGLLKSDVGLRALLGGDIFLKRVHLADTRATLTQDTDSVFNFQFIIDAFVGEEPSAPVVEEETGGGPHIRLGQVRLERIHYTMHLAPSSLELELRLGELDLGFDRFALDPLIFHAGELRLNNTRLDLRLAGGDPTPPAYPELENPLADIDVRFRRIALEAVNFTMKTTGSGDSLWLGLRHGEVRTRAMASVRQHIDLERVDIAGLDFGMLAMSGEDVPDTTAHPDPLWLDRDDGFRYWTQDWDLAIGDLRIAQSRFALHTDSIATPSSLADATQVVSRGIELQAQGIAVNNSRIAMELERMRVAAGPDTTSLELSFALVATPETIALHKGRISAMDNTIAFQLRAHPGDLSRAYRTPYAVPLEAELSAQLRMAGLHPLLAALGIALPAAASAEEIWDTRAWLQGTANSAESMGLHLTGDQGSRIRLEGRTRRAENWPFNDFALHLEEFVMGKGIRQVARAFAPPDVTFPQHLSMRGDASGERGTLRTVLALNSDLGRVTGFAVVHDWSGNMPDGLDLALTLSAIDAGRIVGDTSLGPIDLKVVAGGEDLNGPSRRGSISVTPTALTYAGNDLSSLRLHLTAQGDSLAMGLMARAEHADLLLDAKGRWPQPGDSLAVDLDLVMRKLQLQELGLVGWPLDLSGGLAGRLAFSPEFHGSTKLGARDLRLSNGNEEFLFQRFRIGALLASDSTAVELDSDAITLTYHSNLGADSIVPRAQQKITSFFQPEGAFEPVAGRRMDLKMTLPRTEWLTDIVFPELDAIELRRFDGYYDSDTDQLGLHIDVPHLDYAGVDLHGLALDLDAEGNKLQGAMRLARVERDSMYLENLALEANTANDALDATFRITDAGDDRYRIGATLRREDGIPVLHMTETFLLNKRDWAAHPENALRFTEEGPRAEHFELTSQGERVAMRTGRQRQHIEFEAFRLSTISQLVGTSDSLPLVRGRTTGIISLPFVDAGRLEADLTIRELAIQGVPMGDLRMQAAEIEAARYRGEITLDGPGNQLRAKADADLRGERPHIRADAELAFQDLSFLKPFVTEYLFAVEGGLDGHLRYEQHGDDMSIIGRTTFTRAGVGVIQTGAMYRLPKETVVFDAEGMLFDRVTVLDTAGNRFQLDGRIHTAKRMVPGLDLRLRTDRFQLVNSTIEDNAMFFGQLFGGIDLRIGGTALNPDVRGDVGILDGTAISIVLPGSRVELIDHEGIVEFTTDFGRQDTLAVRTDSEMLRDSLAAQLPGVALDLRIRLDKRARFAVVIDPTTGDQATFSGEADLRFRYAPDSDMDLRGSFAVADGGYTLEFYGLVKKRFELVPGGTVVWDGDPLRGRMDIQARYRADAAPFPLVANARGGITESERNRLQARLPFDVLINIRELIDNPAISFGLELDRLSRNNFPQVGSRLDQLAQPANEEELNRQVFGLLVLNTFIEDDGASGQPSASLATTAARNSVNSILTDQLNRLTGQMIKGMDIQLGVNTYDQSAGGELYQRTSVDYRVSQRILNDRVRIEAGGSLGVDERQQGVSGVSNNRAAQYAISYDLTTDGRLRLRAFHENAFDLYDGEIINNGIAITITREFEENHRDRERKREEAKRRQQATNKEEE